MSNENTIFQSQVRVRNRFYDFFDTRSLDERTPEISAHCTEADVEKLIAKFSFLFTKWPFHRNTCYEDSLVTVLNWSLYLLAHNRWFSRFHDTHEATLKPTFPRPTFFRRMQALCPNVLDQSVTDDLLNFLSASSLEHVIDQYSERWAQVPRSTSCAAFTRLYDIHALKRRFISLASQSPSHGLGKGAAKTQFELIKQSVINEARHLPTSPTIEDIRQEVLNRLKTWFAANPGVTSTDVELVLNEASVCQISLATNYEAKTVLNK